MEKTKQVLKVQGDVFFVKINALPEEFSNPPRKIEPKSGKIVLRRGEKTGHEHAIEFTDEILEGIEVFEFDNFVYISTDRPLTVKHPEHRPIMLESGVWRMGIQREFNYIELEEAQNRD